MTIENRFQIHNVAEISVQQGGWLLQRVPEALRTKLNPKAQYQARSVPGVEIRFVWDWNQPAKIRLSSLGKASVSVFFGPFQSRTRPVVGDGGVEIVLQPSQRLRETDVSQFDALSFSPRVGRLLLAGDPVVLHEVEGKEMRPPNATELPPLRYLAYGSSITDGIDASAPHLAYPARIARAMGWDSLNLGFRGSAFAEADMADYIAERDDWDILTLEGSVNMVGEFSTAEFEQRWHYFISRIAAANPLKPIVILNMFLHFRDLPFGLGAHENAQKVAQMRQALRDIVRELNSPNVTILENESLIREPMGLTEDLLHPSDDGFDGIARGVITHLQAHYGFQAARLVFRHA